jgi:photosystem II stability/assembly factor-like uncharacterized protein
MVRTVRLLPCALAGALALPCAAPAQGATLSGTIAIPVSDGGYRPTLAASKAPRVRVEGTSLETAVVVTDRYAGTFTLTGVPTGPVTLIYVETPGEDSFTMASRRLEVNVTGDLSGLTFALEHHWTYLPSYPPPWRDPAYDIWEPYFVSAKIGFVLFVNRGVSPQQSELWRTTNGGTSWRKIGHWTHRPDEVHPDVTGRSMLFAGANAGVISARTTVPVGLLRTADGGGTWSFVELPHLPTSNRITPIHLYARIDATRWIACGHENTGTYMGVGSPLATNVWETTDAGASWQIQQTLLTLGGEYDTTPCTAMEADPSGKAILFATPYAFGGGMHRQLRSTAGVWSPVAGNDLIANTGYGTADVPMLGDAAWVGVTRYSPVGPGLFQSLDAGATFRKISDFEPQSLDFASMHKGLSTAGGPMYATYDGGLTWLMQSGGGGICCHGNFVWLFDTMSAVWKDGGVGDPNDLSDIFTYVEPRIANVEVLPGTAIPPGSIAPGAANVGIVELRFVNNGPMPLKVVDLRLRASGSGDDRADVSRVKAWWDRDANGIVDAEDPLLASGVYPADDGEVALNLGSKFLAQARVPFDVLVTYDFTGAPTRTGTFVMSVNPATVMAQSADAGPALVVAATAPLGTVLASSAFSLGAGSLVLSDLTLKKSETAGCLSVSGTVTLSEPAPAAGIVVRLADTLAAASTPATVTIPAGATTKTFAVKTTPVALTEIGTVRATLGPVTLSRPLAVRPIGMLSVALAPTPVVGGLPVNGIAKLECKAGPGPIVVDLASTNPAVAHPTVASIVLPVGTQTGAFVVETTSVAVTTKPAIRATANGITKSKTLVVNPAP